MSASLRAQYTGTEAGTVTLTGVVAGDTILVTLRERDGSTMSVSDSLNGAYTEDVTRAVNAARTSIFRFSNSAGGNPVLTVSGGTVRDFNASIWSGVTNGAPDTTNATGSGSATSLTHGSVTPSATALLITSLGSTDHGGVTIDPTFTGLNIDGAATSNRQAYSYRVGFSGSVNPTHTATASCAYDAVVAAYLETAGGAGPSSRFVAKVRRTA